MLVTCTNITWDKDWVYATMTDDRTNIVRYIKGRRDGKEYYVDNTENMSNFIVSSIWGLVYDLNKRGKLKKVETHLHEG